MTYTPKLDRIESDGTSTPMALITQAELDELKKEKEKLSVLSKSDAAALGIADMTGPQMRMHILKLEGELCEMKQAMKEMLEMSRAVYCIGCGAELDRGEQHSCACPWDRIRELLNG